MIRGRFTGRFTIRGLGCLWVLLATSVAAGVLAGGLLLGALSPAAASRSAQQTDLPFLSGRMMTERADPLPSPDSAGRTGAPHDPASVSAAVSGDARPAGAPSSPATGMRAASSEAPRSRIPLRGIATPAVDEASARTAAGTISGVATWFRSPAGVSAAGPALRRALGPNWRGTIVRVTANGRSITTKLGDWMRADWLIDLHRPLFAALAPLSRGVLEVTVEW